MSNDHPLISQVKIAAKRLKKSIPDKSLMQIQDIATHAITGKSSFHELVKSCNEPQELHSKNETPVNWGELNNVKPLFNHGSWHYYPDRAAIALERTKLSPYVISLDQISSPSRLLDTILHIQSKRSHLSEDWIGTTSVFEIDNFILISQNIFTYYFDARIQEQFAIKDSIKAIAWPEILDRKHKEYVKQGEVT